MSKPGIDFYAYLDESEDEPEPTPPPSSNNVDKSVKKLFCAVM